MYHDVSNAPQHGTLSFLAVFLAVRFKFGSAKPSIHEGCGSLFDPLRGPLDRFTLSDV